MRKIIIVLLAVSIIGCPSDSERDPEVMTLDDIPCENLRIPEEAEIRAEFTKCVVYIAKENCEHDNYPCRQQAVQACGEAMLDYLDGLKARIRDCRGEAPLEGVRLGIPVGF